MYKCLDCENEFAEDEAKIIEYGSGAVLSKVEYISCPLCDSTNVQDQESGKIQGNF
jgi:DNA-directed RNA polymerase subunit RPC12/RpoP